MKRIKKSGLWGGYSCPRCRRKVKYLSKFCGYCGVDVEWEICPKCGCSAETKDDFCTNCGKYIREVLDGRT